MEYGRLETGVGAGLGPATSNSDYQEHQRAAQISGSVYTLDAPDSAFGMRPYVFRDGDRLRIDCVLKLTNEQRYKELGVLIPSQSGNASHGNEAAYHTTYGTYNTWKITQDDLQWTNRYYDDEEQDNLFYSNKRNIDEFYSILVGKYYCFEPYFGIGMELDRGRHTVQNDSWSWQSNTGQKSYAPSYRHGWTLPLSAAKEIVDGEIVPPGFFKVSERMKNGSVSGFSNNTLGFVRSLQSDDDATPGICHYVFDAVYNKLSKWNGSDNNGDIDNGGTWDPAKQSKDFNYDTVSTMQMGLRSLLLEVNTNLDEVRPHRYERTATNKPRYYSEWFACPDISTIFQQSHWYGVFSGGHTQTGGAHSGGTGNVYTSIYHPSVSTSVVGSFAKTYHDKSTKTIDGNDYIESLKYRSVHPHKYLCSIVRRVVPYGGHSKESIESTRYIPCGNFHPVSATNKDSGYNDRRQAHLSKVYGGDTFLNLYSHQKTAAPYMKHSAARWQVFPVESYVNTDMRSGLALTNGDTELGKKLNTAPYSNDWLYNSVYSQENNVKAGIMIDETQPDSLDLPYEIAYSNTKILGQKTDAFRQFPINQFHDMEGLYGEINRIVNFKNEIYVLQDSSFAKLLVNPLSMLSDDAGNSLFTGTGETVENHLYVSTKYGTRHRFSVAQSETSLYFVDSNFARIFKYDTDKLISLGDSLGQRNYLKEMIKNWSHERIKYESGYDDELKGRLDNKEKIPGDRDYFSDNPLKFLGIYSIFDFENKELLISFHNSAWDTISSPRLTFANPETNHTMGSTTNGQPIKKSETLVYSEAINSFTSRYTVAPPQWMSAGGGSFLLCPENEISVYSIANIGSYDHLPYSSYGSYDNYPATNFQSYRNYRCNPLSLWIWNRHDKKKKGHFFGEKDDLIYRGDVVSPVDGSTNTGTVVEVTGTKDIADEAYIEKVINDDAGTSKVFDNTRVIMTPKEVPFSNVKFSTETVDEQLINIHKRWDFDDTDDGWRFWDGSGGFVSSSIYNTGASTVSLIQNGGQNYFRSPNRQNAINILGRQNYIVRARIKRVSGSGWEGDATWIGYNEELANASPPVAWSEIVNSSSRRHRIPEPDGIDNDFVIVQWDMRKATDGTYKYEESVIRSISLEFSDTDGDEIEVDWVEIGSYDSPRYDDGILKLPLRTEESVRRTRGTWAKIKYSAKTTDKFNFFAILAKYRQLYKK